MQKLNVTIKKDEAGLLVTMSVITLATIHFRSFRPPDGYTWEEIAFQAERMALARWPGETQYKLCLPLGDCGAPRNM